MGDPWSYLARLGVRPRHPDDPFFSDGDAVCSMRTCTYLTQIDTEEFLHPDYPDFPCPAPECPATFVQLIDFEGHYATLHRHQCVECGKTLPTAHLLELHLSEKHDSFFAVSKARKASFQCFLQKCRDLFWSPRERRAHCVNVHQFKEDFFDDEEVEEEVQRMDTTATESQIPRPTFASPRQQQQQSSSTRTTTTTRTSSLSPKLKHSSNSTTTTPQRRSSVTPRRRVTRPQSLMILNGNIGNDLSPVVAQAAAASRIPVARSAEKKSSNRSRASVNEKASNDRSTRVAVAETTTTGEGRPLLLPVATGAAGSPVPPRRFSLAMITGHSSAASTESDMSSDRRNPSPKSSRRRLESEKVRKASVSSAAAAGCREQRSSLPTEIFCDSEAAIVSGDSPQKRAPLSLARMGERLSLSRPCLLGDSSSIISPVSSGIGSMEASGSSSHNGNGNGGSSAPNSAITSPSKRLVQQQQHNSRIPVPFKRSQSLKVPKQISFGSDVEKAFVSSNKLHWHSRTDGSSVAAAAGMTTGDDNGVENMDEGSFEAHMRDALSQCQF